SFLMRDRERLDAFDILTACYLVAFCIGPLFQVDPPPPYYHPFSSLLAATAAFVFGAYLALGAGYFLPRVFRDPPPEPTHPSVSDGAVESVALRLFYVGLACYLLLVFAAGGLTQFFTSDKHRMELYSGVVGVGWLTSLLTSGSVLYCARWASDETVGAWRS